VVPAQRARLLMPRHRELLLACKVEIIHPS
jgi:hypothetical protein